MLKWTLGRVDFDLLFNSCYCFIFDYITGISMEGKTCHFLVLLSSYIICLPLDIETNFGQPLTKF
jgi:hypothetical protein